MKRSPMLAWLDEVDRELAPLLAQETTSCRKGCGSCCHSLVTITLTEARALLPHVTPAIREKLATWYARFPPIPTEEDYWRLKIPCVFLSNDQECTVYADRPGVCRFTFALSPASECEPGREQTILDLSTYHLARFAKSYALREGSDACLPLPVALRTVLDTDENMI